MATHMLPVVLALLGLLFLFAVVLLAVAAYLRAEEARETLRLVQRRLGVIEKQLGIARPAAAAAPAAAEQAAPKEEASLEERLALVWLTRIGAAVLLLGGTFFLVYGPSGQAGAWRLGAAALVGAAALAIAEVSRRRARPLFNQVLLGLGAAVLQFASVAGCRLYDVVGPAAALAGAAGVFALGCALSVRHATQVPLAISFAGAMAAPALLPPAMGVAGLFAWLLAHSAVALAVALRWRFPAALWLVPIGGAAAFGAWLARGGGAGLGARPLADRVPALALAALAAAAWLGAQALARRPGRERLRPAGFLILAGTLAHGLFAALLGDQPPLLVAVFAALTIAGAWLARGESAWTLAPQLALSFLLLLGAVNARSPGVATFLPLAAWGAAYVLAFQRHPGRLASVLVGLAGAAFLVVAGGLLAPLRWRWFGLVTVLWAVACAWLAMVRREPWLLAGTTLVSFLGLVGAAVPIAEHGDRVLLLLCMAWVLVQFGGLAFRIRSQQETPELVHVLTASGSGVALGSLVLLLAPAEPLLRGALAAASGAGHVALGGMLLQRSPRTGNALQGVAVALLAVAAMHAMPGAASTLAWAVLATLLVAAGFRRRSPLLRWLGLGMFAATIVRVAVWDAWRLHSSWEVGVIVAVGVLALAGSYLYARWANRLAGLQGGGHRPAA